MTCEPDRDRDTPSGWEVLLTMPTDKDESCDLLPAAREDAAFRVYQRLRKWNDLLRLADRTLGEYFDASGPHASASESTMCDAMKTVLAYAIGRKLVVTAQGFLGFLVKLLTWQRKGTQSAFYSGAASP